MVQEPAMSPPSPLRLRDMERTDVPFAVQQHRLHFGDGFFAQLGPRFLTAYYRAYAFTGGALAYVAETDGKVVGYLVGATDPQAHRRDILRQHGFELLLRGVSGLLLQPRLAAHFFRTRAKRYAIRLLRRSRSSTGHAAAPGGPVAILAHVAVTVDEQGRGAGSALVKQFLEDAATKGCRQVVLVTTSGAQGAGEFYVRRGWEPCNEHIDSDGRSLTSYKFLLSDAIKPGT